MESRGLTEELLRVFEAPTLFRERLLLSGLYVRLLELTHLEAEEVDPADKLAAVLLKFLQLGLEPGKAVERLPYGGSVLLGFAEGVQDAALRVLPEERLVFVLPVQIHERSSEISHGTGRGRGLVDPSTVPARRRHLSSENQQAVLGLDPQVVHLSTELWVVRNIEDRLDHRALRAGPHRVTGCTFPQQKRERSDDNRFPRPGLPGKSAQPGSQFKGQIMDDRVVLNAEFDEHASMYPERPRLQWSNGRYRPIRWALPADPMGATGQAELRQCRSAGGAGRPVELAAKRFEEILFGKPDQRDLDFGTSNMDLRTGLEVVPDLSVRRDHQILRPFNRTHGDPLCRRDHHRAHGQRVWTDGRDDQTVDRRHYDGATGRQRIRSGSRGGGYDQPVPREAAHVLPAPARRSLLDPKVQPSHTGGPPFVNHEVVPRQKRLIFRAVGTDDVTLQGVPAIQHIVAVQHQPQMLLELRMPEGR